MIVRPSLVDRRETVLAMCRGMKVLHLGCTDAPYTEASIQNDMLLHSHIARVAEDIVGIDGDAAAIQILAQQGFTGIVRADLEQLDNAPLAGIFDVIVAGEVIEHLNNPGLFLTGIKRFMGKQSVLLITTINAYCGMRFFQYGFRGRGGEAEPVHPDHVAYYSYKTLRLLLTRHGLRVREFMFYDVGREHRIHNRRALNVINDICVRIAPHWADGLIAVCEIAP